MVHYGYGVSLVISEISVKKFLYVAHSCLQGASY